MVLLHGPIVPNGLDTIDHPFDGEKGGKVDVEQAETSIYQLYLLTFLFYAVSPPPLIN